MTRSTSLVIPFFAILYACGGESGVSTSEPMVASVTHDFSTPEGALLSLEDAYRREDIEAAVQAKDFRIEARLMLLTKTKLPPDQIDEELIGKAAEVLELAYRAQMEQEGYPDMKGVKSTFPEKKPYQDGIVLITEVCEYPDGGSSTQKILVAETPAGWRVLNVVE